MSMQRNIEKDMISKVRVPLLILFTCYFLISLSYSQSVELPCSKNGTTLFYINGMFNSDGEAQLSLSEVKNLYSRENEKKTIDSSGETYFDYVYQQSLYKMNSESTPLPDEVGRISDLIEVAGEYIQDKIELGERDDATFWQAMGSYYFKAGTTVAQVHPFLSAIEDLDRRYQGFFVEEFDDTVEEADLQRMMSNVRNRLVDDQMKMIIVSHSQGNFYANSLWNRLIRDGGIDKNYENYWGNMQVASPASYIAAKHESHITAHQDKVMNSSYVLGNLASNIYFDSSYVGVDEDGHSFDLYLSSTVNGSYFSNQSMSEPMESIFRSRMTDIAKSLAPNCGCDEEDYPLAVHENGGGLIGQFAEVSPLARVNSGATVCGESIVSNYVLLKEGTVIKNSKLTAPLSTLEPEEILSEIDKEFLPYHLLVENAEVNDSTIRGFVNVVGDSNSENKVKIINQSVLDSNELDDLSLLSSGYYHSGDYNNIYVGPNIEIDNSIALGSVSLDGENGAGYTPRVRNSLINNFVDYRVSHSSLYGSGYLSVHNHNISNSTISKTNIGSYQVGGREASSGDYINNLSSTNSSLVGKFKIDHLNVKNSHIAGHILMSGSNNFNNVGVLNRGDNMDTSLVTRFRDVNFFDSASYSEYYDGHYYNSWCNAVLTPVDLNSVNATCSKIDMANIEDGELSFSWVRKGSYSELTLDRSVLRGHDFSMLNKFTALDFSEIDLPEADMLPEDITVKRSRLRGTFVLEPNTRLERVNVSGEIELGQSVGLISVILDGHVKVNDNVRIRDSRVSGSEVAPSEIGLNTEIENSVVVDSTLENDVDVKGGSLVDIGVLKDNSVVDRSFVRGSAARGPSQLSRFAKAVNGSDIVNGATIAASVTASHSYINAVTLEDSVEGKDCQYSMHTNMEVDCYDLTETLVYPELQNYDDYFEWQESFSLGVATGD